MADLSKNTYGYDGPSRQAWRSTVPYNSRLLQYTADIVIDEGAKDADPAFARFPAADTRQLHPQLCRQQQPVASVFPGLP